jgi:hypothetical protein
MYPDQKAAILWETPVTAFQAPHIYSAALAWNIFALICMFLLYTLGQIPWVIQWLLDFSSSALLCLQKIPFLSSLAHVCVWISEIDISSKGVFVRNLMCYAVGIPINLAMLMGKYVSAWIHRDQVIKGGGGGCSIFHPSSSANKSDAIPPWVGDIRQLPHVFK